ncbi:unnamed protein product [Amoebophrya sp. A120]|nr:unnamed protein product [Amoebophrya sp. A120]|eukprot:GSA120T00017975001.1
MHTNASLGRCSAGSCLFADISITASWSSSRQALSMNGSSSCGGTQQQPKRGGGRTCAKRTFSFESLSNSKNLHSLMLEELSSSKKRNPFPSAVDGLVFAVNEDPSSCETAKTDSITSGTSPELDSTNSDLFDCKHKNDLFEGRAEIHGTPSTEGGGCPERGAQIGSPAIANTVGAGPVGPGSTTCLDHSHIGDENSTSIMMNGSAQDLRDCDDEPVEVVDHNDKCEDEQLHWAEDSNVAGSAATEDQDRPLENEPSLSTHDVGAAVPGVGEADVEDGERQPEFDSALARKGGVCSEDDLVAQNVHEEEVVATTSPSKVISAATSTVPVSSSGEINAVQPTAPAVIAAPLAALAPSSETAPPLGAGGLISVEDLMKSPPVVQRPPAAGPTASPESRSPQSKRARLIQSTGVLPPPPRRSKNTTGTSVVSNASSSPLLQPLPGAASRTSPTTTAESSPNTESVLTSDDNNNGTTTATSESAGTGATATKPGTSTSAGEVDSTGGAKVDGVVGAAAAGGTNKRSSTEAGPASGANKKSAGAAGRGSGTTAAVSSNGVCKPPGPAGVDQQNGSAHATGGSANSGSGAHTKDARATWYQNRHGSYGNHSAGYGYGTYHGHGGYGHYNGGGSNGPSGATRAHNLSGPGMHYYQTGPPPRSRYNPEERWSQLAAEGKIGYLHYNSKGNREQIEAQPPWQMKNVANGTSGYGAGGAAAAAAHQAALRGGGGKYGKFLGSGNRPGPFSHPASGKSTFPSLHQMMEHGATSENYRGKGDFGTGNPRAPGATGTADRVAPGAVGLPGAGFSNHGGPGSSSSLHQQNMDILTSLMKGKSHHLFGQMGGNSSAIIGSALAGAVSGAGNSGHGVSSWMSDYVNDYLNANHSSADKDLCMAPGGGKDDEYSESEWKNWLNEWAIGDGMSTHGAVASSSPCRAAPPMEHHQAQHHHGDTSASTSADLDELWKSLELIPAPPTTNVASSCSSSSTANGLLSTLLGAATSSNPSSLSSGILNAPPTTSGAGTILMPPPAPPTLFAPPMSSSMPLSRSTSSCSSSPSMDYSHFNGGGGPPPPGSSSDWRV